MQGVPPGYTVNPGDRCYNGAMMNSRSRSSGMLLIVVLAASGALLFLGQNQPITLSRWPGNDTADRPVPTIGAMAVPAADPALLNIVVDDGLYSNERMQLDADVRRAYAYASGRFGGTLNAPVTVAVVQDPGCALSGIAYTDVRTLQVQTCNGVARSRAIAILAHEYIHQLQHDRYGSRHLNADLILSEGMATWAAGEYWLGGHADFRSYVRAQRAGGVFYPLATHYAGRSIGEMNALYYQWASFVEFLMSVYGRELFDQVYITGAGDPGSAGYADVYGKDLITLEQEWIAWLGA